MNFNEKLIELRKKAGLSQEDLGNKLNVTRQTVSKWELGQTTPEMDKIKEISNLFNISVDELLNDKKVDEIKENNNESIVNSNSNQQEEKSREKIVLGIIVGVLIICVGWLLYYGIMSHKTNKKFFDGFFGIFDKITNKVDELENESKNPNFEIPKIDIDLKYSGSLPGISAKEAIIDIININNKGDNIVVNFEGKDYQGEEIEKIKSLIKDSKVYSFEYEYENKKIIKVIIKLEITELDLIKHNGSFESLYSGMQFGIVVIDLLNEINKTNESSDKKITLDFLGKEYIDSKEIRNLIKDIDSFTKYNVYYEKDAQGFINKAIIEEVK